MPRSLHEAPDTLSKIFPEYTYLEEKALHFLELYDSCGSFRKTAKALGKMEDSGEYIHHNTVARLYQFLKDTEVYAQYTWEKNEQVKDFLSKDFLGAIHDDYKEQKDRIEKRIRAYIREEKFAEALEWIKEKRLLLKDMVSTAISLAPKAPMQKLPIDEQPQPDKASPEYEKALAKWKETHPDA